MTGVYQKYAPGWPDIPAKRMSSAKSGVGTALNAASRVWFTLSHCIFNEIYFPRVDQACTRDLGLIVTDGREFFSEEKSHARRDVGYLAAGVPAYRLVNTCAQGRYSIEKRSLPRRIATRCYSAHGSRLCNGEWRIIAFTRCWRRTWAIRAPDCDGSAIQFVRVPTEKATGLIFFY